MRKGCYFIPALSPFISPLCFSSVSPSHSSGAVYCSCSARGSLGCSVASKSAHWLRSSGPPSDRSSCPGRTPAGTDPRRGWLSAPPPSSSSSPATTYTTWRRPPRRESPRRSMSFKWGHCDPQGLDFSPHHSVCLRTKHAKSKPKYSCLTSLDILCLHTVTDVLQLVVNIQPSAQDLS